MNKLKKNPPPSQQNDSPDPVLTEPDPAAIVVFFCLVNRYSHATYLDHGEIMYSPFRPPLSLESAHSGKFFFFVYSHSSSAYLDYGGKKRRKVRGDEYLLH